ncbi:OmpA family protein [Flavobacterium sp. RHBU_3]|uniref:OmpA family protein n=1 Tax=Flavobacterium sp. RHBU_3 TaxID=3391184 RepID=UPI0039849BA2
MNKLFIPTLFVACAAFAQKQQKFTVYFPFNKDVATDESVAKLFEWISENPEASINLLEGDADKTGNEYYNIDLSERRIAYVLGFLDSSENFDLTATNRKAFGESRAKAGHSAPDRKVTIYFTEKEIVPAAIAPPEKKEPSDFAKKITNSNKGDKIRIPDLHFYNNSDIVLPSSEPILKDLLSVMVDNPTLKIDIQGHICCQKNEEHEISKRRAITVYAYLIKNGIAKERLSYQSFGSTRPIYKLPEKNEEERVANRRVEIEILNK